MQLDPAQEKEIIVKVKRDKRYFDLIFQAYVKSIYAYAYSLTKDKMIAEDITAETFSLALSSIQTFNWRGISIKYWLFQIARNRLKTHWRQEQKLIFDNDLTDHQSGGQVDVLDHLINKEKAKYINDYLNKLPQLSAEVIRLKIWEEFNFDQIAKLTGQKLSTVKMAYYRGLAKLKEWLSQPAEGLENHLAGK